MPRNYKLYMEDILEAIEKVATYLQGMNFEAFENDSLRIDAVLRNLQIIGEATKNLPERFRTTYSAVEWKRIVAFRNLAAHVYFGIKLETVWSIIRDDLPTLRATVQQMLKDALEEAN
jgi:uncharacterized protein with HEPN domain